MFCQPKNLAHNAMKLLIFNSLPSHSNTEVTLYSVVRHCRTYFEAGSTEQILKEFLPHLCPFDDEMNVYIRYLDMFLPVAIRQNGRPPSHHLWRHILLG